MKKRLTIVVLGLFILSMLTGTATAKKAIGNSKHMPPGQLKKTTGYYYRDIDNDWAADDINTVIYKGYMNGYGDGSFQPNKPVTNVELIAVLVNALAERGDIDLDEVDVDQYKNLLTKVPEWAKVKFAAALDLGIINENEIRTLNPNQGVKRYQVAVYMSRIIGDNDDIYAIDLEKIFDNVIESVEILNDLENDVAKELDIDDLIEDLIDLKWDIHNLAEEIITQEEIAAISESFTDIIADLEEIIEYAEDNDGDEDIIEDFNDVLNLLDGSVDKLEIYSDNYRFYDEEQIPYQSRSAVRLMERLYIMNGDTNGSFSPMRVVKRNELAVMLNRMDDNCSEFNNYNIVIGILSKVINHNDLLKFYVIDEDGDPVDLIQANENTRVYYDGELIDNSSDIQTGGEIRLCLNDKEELIWVRIKSADEDEDYKTITGKLYSFTHQDDIYKFNIIMGKNDDLEMETVESDKDTIVIYDDKLLVDADDVEVGGEVTVLINAKAEVERVVIDLPENND